MQDTDTYWHVAVGRWIVENATVPTSDPFTHSMPGTPWTAFEWLSELLIFGAYSLGGWAGLVLLTACRYAVVLALMTRFLLARMEAAYALLFTGLAAGMMMTHALARPHVLAWVLLAIWVATLVNASESLRRPPWWLLSVMLLWANMHGSFLLGLVLGVGVVLNAVVAHPRGKRIAASRFWALFIALSVGAALLTPNGSQVITHTLHIVQMKVALATLMEWWSPNFQQAQPLELWLLLILGLALAGRVRLPWVRVLIVLGLVHL